jgi:hypothetical protein
MDEALLHRVLFWEFDETCDNIRLVTPRKASVSVF